MIVSAMGRKRTIRRRRGSPRAKLVSRALKPIDLACQWQQGLSRLTPMAVAALSATQKQAGEILELMGRSTQAKVGLMHQAIRAAGDPNPLGSQAKWMGFWMSAIGLAQTNTATVLQIHSRAFNSWLRLMSPHS